MTSCTTLRFPFWRIAGPTAAVFLFTIHIAPPVAAQLSFENAELFQQGWDGLPGTSALDDRFGASMASGDFDGNGRLDLALGAPGETVSDFVGTGQVTVLYQEEAGLDPSTAQPLAVEDFGIGNAILDEQFGYVLAAGNFDGDAYDDLAIGVPWRTYLPMGGPAVWNTGMVLVIHGGAGGLDLGNTQLLMPGLDGLIGAAEDDDRFGRVLAAGDFNDDGTDDLAIGAPLKDVGMVADSGVLFVLYGTAGVGLDPTSAVDWTQGGIGLDAEGTGEQFSAALVVGDWDDDGIEDLAIGTPYDEVLGAPAAGSVTVLYGSMGGLHTGGALRITEAGATPGTFGPNDYFGVALASGDLDCDGVDDLAVGVSGNDFPLGPGLFVPSAGAVVLHFGSDAGFALDQGEILYRDVVGEGGVPMDLFGAGLAAGDFDGDGCSELVVGMPGGDPEGMEGAGTSYVLEREIGGGMGLSFVADQAGLGPGSCEVADHLGTHFAVGDFDGDGVEDLGLGIPLDSAAGQEDAGQVILFFGDSGLFTDGFESGDTSLWS